MLRGRRSCAISERATPSPASRNPLSPLFPLHPRNSSVTPLFPLHTQKQGGGAHFSALLLHSSSMLSVSSVVNPLSNADDSNRVEISTASCELSTVNCERASQKPPFARELIEYVGAPTFLSLDRTTTNQQLIDRGTVFSSHCGLSTVNCFSPLSPIIPVHPRNAPVSPIIPVHTQEQGGGVPLRKICSPLTPLFSLAVLTIC